ncbi:sugar-binding domain-containing protein [Haloferula sp. A504]|uniref:sugar-binding domain-containing protein n=1 Tax=Haloferula sp. A504 TaxID=3373601 RepID=UPI0031BEBA64|nr:hypothetical protein [Verrucomicrobiaceae bacterium E54]
MNQITRTSAMKLPLLLILPLITVLCHGAQTMDLSGRWSFQLDADKVGVDQKWYGKALEDSVNLPGTTDENRKGLRNTERVDDRLARPWKWIGAAWYQREVDVPGDWEGKRVTLFLERTKNCQVWVNGVYCGWDDSLSAPHVHQLTEAIRPGAKNTITLLVDNSIMPPVGPSHAVDERTQTNWNGVVGRMELRATDRVWIESVKVLPDIETNRANLRVMIGNQTGADAEVEIRVRGRSVNVDQPETFDELSGPVKVDKDGREWTSTYTPEKTMPLWDEFNPALMELELEIKRGASVESKTVRFGMREFTRDRNLLLMNGKKVFLRGRIDCCLYPLTGYAPMDMQSWLRIYGILKDWGINHVRYHTWCPPMASFEAADELGFYLQPELPNKRSAFKAPDNADAAEYNIDYLAVNDSDAKVSLYDYGKREGELILQYFGNSPSFTMFTLGNELGRNEGMFELVRHFRSIAPDKLYAQGSNNMHWNPSFAEGDDFWVAKAITDDRGNPLPLRGAYYHYTNYKGHIDHQPPSTMVCYSDTISGVPAPMISHENGVYEVFPDFSEIPKFTGVTRGWNYELFKERLEATGMGDQARDFQRASGALAAICKREDIESALRTPDLGGYQLLDIQDFAGQGTALVGMLDLFMDSKGIITPEERRRYCNPTVPLLRVKQYTWTRDEPIRGRVQVSHYGPEDMEDAVVTWSLVDQAGKEIDGGAFDPVTLPQGELTEIDLFCAKVPAEGPAQKLTLWLQIKGTESRNNYPLWVYPPTVDTRVPEGVLVAKSYADAGTQAHLAKGGAVLLLPDPETLPHSVPSAFKAGFWSPMFMMGARKRGLEDPPVTIGMLCDPEHPALRHFPTGFHTNWQWWYIISKSRFIILDETAGDYRPLVQAIDSIGRLHKLGLMFETKVGKGRLFVCAADLQGHLDQPEVRQMLHSLLQYVGSEEFKPGHEIPADLLDKLLVP